MDWLSLKWILPLLAVMPALYLLRVALVTKALLGLRLGPARVSEIPLEELPSGWQETVSALEPRMREAGYARSFCARVVPHSGEAWTTYLIAYRNDAEPISVSVTSNPRADSGGRVIFSLVTLLASGIELHTSNYRSENIVPAPADARDEVLEKRGLATLLRRHRARMAAAGAAGDAAVFLSPEERLVRYQGRLDEMLAALLASGRVAQQKDGRWAYKTGAAIRFCIGLMRRVKARKRNPVRETATNPPIPLSPEARLEFDYQSYHRLVTMQDGKLAWLPKTLLMMVSLAVFALALGWQLSFLSVLVLLATLVFHEGGHLLGMRIFGHRDTQLLFLPFLGGAAVALDDRILKPWQNLVILFLGPLPGFFIGLGLFLWAPQDHILVREFEWALIALNVFNLLPIMPLDGGQILDHALVARFPYVRAIFTAGSGLCLMAVAYMAHGGTMLGVVGLFMVLRVSIEWRSARLIRGLRPEIPPGSEEAVVVRRVLQVLRGPAWARMGAVRRLQLARSFQRTLRQPLPRLGTFLFAAVGYFSPIWVTLAVLAVGAIGTDMKLGRAAADGMRADALVAPPPAAPAHGDNAATDLAEARRLQVEYRKAFDGDDDQMTPEKVETTRENAIRAIHAACGRKDFVPTEAIAVTALSESGRELLAGTYRRIHRGQPEDVAVLIDDMVRLTEFAAAVRTQAGVATRLELMSLTQRAVEVLTASVPKSGIHEPWRAVLDEPRLRAQLIETLRTSAWVLAHPDPSERSRASGILGRFSQWSDDRTRADELDRTVSVIEQLGSGHFEPISLDGKRRLSGTGRDFSALAFMPIRLLASARLARLAATLHRLPQVSLMAGPLPATVLSPDDVHPLTGLPPLVVTDPQGLVLRFGPRVEPTVTKMLTGNLPLELMLSDVEWRLTSVHAPESAVP
ncbi:MAG TPA: site-2 protease family protein [Candidatus Didemnitutus sp.]|jgi:Zn-dependent protease